jgi:hypothetical protein
VAFNSKFQVIQERESALRAKQLKKNYIAGYILLGFVVLMFMAALLHSLNHLKSKRYTAG